METNTTNSKDYSVVYPIGPAAFSAFKSQIFRPQFLSENFILSLDDAFVQSQTEQESFKVSDKYHKMFSEENLKTAPLNQIFSHSCKTPGTYYLRNYINALEIPNRCNFKTLSPNKFKKNQIKVFLGMVNFLRKHV